MTSSYDPGSKFRINGGYVPGPQYDPSSGFGPRNPPKGGSKFHYGIDFAAPRGTPIPAAANGKVYYTGAASGYGNVVVLKHEGMDGAPYFTVYGHMDELPNFTKGQRVEAGDEIGKVGSKGHSSGPHLHFETVDGNTRFNNEINGSSTGVKGDVNRVDPNTFGFHGNPVYHGAGAPAASPSSPDTLPSTALPTNSPAGAPLPRPQLSPGLPVPGAEGSISIGGPNGPTPLVPLPPAPNQGERSDIHGVVTPDAAQVIADRFGKWGSVPFLNTPAASDDPAGLNDRHGNWASRPAGVLGNFNAPPLHPPDLGKRSEADDDVPVRVLSSRVVNTSPASGDAPPLASASASPALGIFSGQPMPDWPVWPSIFATDNRPSPDDDELYQRWRRFIDA